MVIDPAVASSASSSIVVALRDGSRIEEATSVPLGAPENPVSDAELVEKFDGLARLVLSRDTAGRLADAVLSLDRAANVRILPAMLRGDGPRSST